MGILYVVGLGPGREDMLTVEARNILDTCDIIAGYKTYIDIVKQFMPDKEYYSNGMRAEKERCETCVRLAMEGNNVALVCSGDAGIYGMAALVYEVAEGSGFGDIVIVPGITAAVSGAAVLGAPINHDFCVISLSDLLTPWELIEKRLESAASGDFVITLYNPSSHKRHDYLAKARDILMRHISGDRCCGYVKNIGRDGEEYRICSLSELSDDDVDMFTTVFIGNSNTRVIGGKLVTPRGYVIR